MSRRMSCSLTVDAVRDRTKTVTRRSVDTWWMLKVGDRLTLVEKAQGLRKGESQVVLAEVEIVDVRTEPLGAITADDMRREGSTPADITVDEWMAWWARSHGYRLSWAIDSTLKRIHPMTRHRNRYTHLADVPVRRIEWRYL